ncbi:MAG: hypothetical protein K0B11_16480 [Mariniphaga sp.]|nr:hypothetical protein [Mariniphaga sp.]
MKTQKISDEQLITQAIEFYKETCKMENVDPGEPDPSVCQVSNKKIYLVNKAQGFAIIRIHHGKLYFKLNGIDYNCQIQAKK